MRMNRVMLVQSLAMTASAGLLGPLSLWLSAAKRRLPVPGRPGQPDLEFMVSFPVSSPCLSLVQGCAEAEVIGQLEWNLLGPLRDERA